MPHCKFRVILEVQYSKSKYKQAINHKGIINVLSSFSSYHTILYIYRDI